MVESANADTFGQGAMASRDSTPGDERLKLIERLEELSHGQGVWREDLLDLLQGRLNSLRHRWGINLDEGIDTARSIIAATLNGHIRNLYPSRGNQPLTDKGDVARHQFILSVSFNIADQHQSRQLNLQELRKKNLEGRRKWLAERFTKASTRTSRRVLKEGIEQIAERLASGVEAPPVEVPIDEAEEPSADATAPPSRSKNRTPLLIALSATLVALLVAGLLLLNTFRSSSGPEPISIQNSPIDFQSGQFTSPDLVVPESLGQLERPPAMDQTKALNDWMTKHGAVHANRASVSFLVRSGQTAPTEILAARVNVERRDAPMSGTWIEPSGAGPQPVRQLYVDLDVTPPKITKPSGWDFPLRVSESDPEAFSVTARTKTCHCFWTIELDVQLPDGQSKVVAVNDNGKPFELTSSINTSAKTYLPSSESDPWPSS